LQISRSSRGEFSEGGKEREQFDNFCRLYSLLFFFREPHLQQIENFKETFGQHIVIQDEAKILQNKLWVCFQDYFDKYFISTNGEAPTNKKASKGWYLFKQYKLIRNEIFLEWQRIFWRPSHTITGHCLKGIDPSITECRPACPFILIKMGLEGFHCFGFEGRTVEKHGGVFKPTLHLKTLVYDNGRDHNPFNWLVSETFDLINEVLARIYKLLEQGPLSITDRQKWNFPKTELPSLPLTINSLCKVGDLQFVLDLLCGYISSLKQMLAPTVEDAGNFNQLEASFKNLRRFLEHTDMHLFLAAWTLWDRPEQPYIVNFLMRAQSVHQFHMLLTEEFLGTFYMVCFNFVIFVTMI
jgi:hypothetical protein